MPSARWSPLLLALTATVAFADIDRNDRLRRGDILLEAVPVPGSDEPEVVLAGVIDAPPEVVWAILEDCDNYKRTMPRIVESQELSRTETHRVCRTLLDSPWPMEDLEAVAEAEIEVVPGRWTRRWWLVRGSFTKYSGSWTLTPFGADGKRTLAVQRSHTVMTAQVPGWIRDIAVQNGMPDVIRSLRTHARLMLAKSP